MLEAFPELKLCADFSHFVNVCERLPEDLENEFRLIASLSIHVHTRVGYEQGPQVPDPRAPEFAPHLRMHQQWWKWVWQARAEAGAKICTATPEFGPPPYLHTLPFTEAPVADPVSVCDWMAGENRKQFTKISGVQEIG